MSIDSQKSKEYWDDQERQDEAQKAQKATKFSDEEIKGWIEDGKIEPDAAEANAFTTTAQAMIAYNNMIDERWAK